MRVICEFQDYAEPALHKIVDAIFSDRIAPEIDELTDAMHVVAREARTIEGRLSKEQWIVGRKLLSDRHGDFPVDSIVAARFESQRRRGARRALLADGAQLSGARSLDRAHRESSRL